MPHVIVECSRKELIQDPLLLLQKMNDSLMQSKEFRAIDIKSRIYFTDGYLIGCDMDNAKDFIAITLKIMPGRTVEIKEALLNGILKVTLDFMDIKTDIEVSVEVLELNAELYQKALFD